MVSKESVFSCPCNQPREFGSSNILESIISKVTNCNSGYPRLERKSFATRATNLRSPVKSIKSVGPRKNEEIPKKWKYLRVNLKKRPIKWYSIWGSSPPILSVSTTGGFYLEKHVSKQKYTGANSDPKQFEEIVQNCHLLHSIYVSCKPKVARRQTGKAAHFFGISTGKTSKERWRVIRGNESGSHARTERTAGLHVHTGRKARGLCTHVHTYLRPPDRGTLWKPLPVRVNVFKESS